MKVLPINNGCSSNSKILSFNGLLGKGTRRLIVLPDVYERKNTYYPFNGETDAEIQRHLKPETLTTEFFPGVDEYVPAEEIRVYESTVLGKRLSFNEKTWNSYMANKYLMDKPNRKFVESTLKGLGLYEYIYCNPIKLIKALVAKVHK